MAKRSKRQKRERVEPRMGDETGFGFLNMRLSDDDRPVSRTAKRKPAKSASGRTSARTRTAAKRSGTKAGGGKRSGTRRSGLGGGFWLFGFLRWLFYWGSVAAIWGTVAVVGVLAYSAATLPQTSEWIIPNRPPNVKIIDARGEILANRGDTGGEAVRLEQLPPHLIEAVMAIEDRRFPRHFGVDPIGLTRAMISNIAAGRVVQGGSTLTQQLAKNLFLEPDRTIERKLQEVVLALWLEANHSKEEILEMYLNRVYFGAGAYGVDAAARRYFGKPARSLTIGEAAMIAGLLKAPSRYAPTRHPELARERAGVVLSAMVRDGYISNDQARIAKVAPSTVVARYSSSSVHYAADWVMGEISDYLSTPEGDVIVHTTIDRELQLKAEQALRAVLTEEGDGKRVKQGAVVVLDRFGAVRALVGGRDYGSSPFNRATDARRQPGSAFKPFVFLAAMERGLLPDDLRIDRPVTIRGWTPSNYKKEHLGPVSLRNALAKSVNTVAAQLANEVGPGQVVRTAQRLGIESRLKANPSIALGTSEVTPLELASAYVPFSNGGSAVDPHVIEKIETRSGKVLYQRRLETPPVAVDGASLAKMNDMMGAVMAYGTGRNAAIADHPSGGKTGTSQSFRDAWFVGYTAYFTAAVWLGNDDNTPTRKVTGGSLPARVWQDFMTAAHQGLAPVPLPGNGAAVFASTEVPAADAAATETAAVEAGAGRAIAANSPIPVPRPRGTPAPTQVDRIGRLIAPKPAARTVREPSAARSPAPVPPAQLPPGSIGSARPAADQPGQADPVGRFINGLIGN